MAKWKRKRTAEEFPAPAPLDVSEMSSLGICLLEQFASGASVPCLIIIASRGFWKLAPCFWHPSYWFFFCLLLLPLSTNKVSIQKTAMAAQKSMPGSSLPDVEEMAAMHNWGRNSNHIAEQMMLKYCQNKQLGLPEPYMVEAPVLVRNNADCAVNVVSKQIAVFLPHEWFAWLGSDKLTPELSEILTGLSGLGDFWKAHDKKDPKLANNPTHCAWRWGQSSEI